MEPEPAPSCGRCQHYHVTWDPLRPRGCRGYGFKTAGLPSVIVERASGLPCQRYASGSDGAERYADRRAADRTKEMP